MKRKVDVDDSDDDHPAYEDDVVGHENLTLPDGQLLTLATECHFFLSTLNISLSLSPLVTL